MRVSVRRSRMVTTVTVAGEVDLLTAPGLRARVLSEIRTSARRLDLDLDGVVFCSAAGLEVLRRAQVAAAERRIEFRLVRPSRAICRVAAAASLGTELGVPSMVEIAVAQHHRTTATGFGHYPLAPDSTPVVRSDEAGLGEMLITDNGP